MRGLAGFGTLLLPLVALLPAAASPPSVTDLVAAGEAAAKPDFPGLGSLCDTKDATTARDFTAMASRPVHAAEPLAPRQVFDNLYFVGVKGVSAWVIRTPAGLVLIDALDNDDEARDYIDTGMRKLGLDPAQIRYLIITHGHGDHYGGANYLIRRYHPRVLMSAADWALVGDDKRRLDVPGFGPPPARDTVAPRRLILGGTQIDLIVTPGHTDGTLSLIFPVIDKGRRHLAVLWGGTGFNFGPEPERFAAYARSANMMQGIVRRRGIDVFLSNHAKRDGTIEKFAAMDANRGGANPFVLTPARVARAFDVFRNCALAAKASLPAS